VKRKIFIVTERRADFSRFKPIIKLIKLSKNLDYDLVVTGNHILKEYGNTINEIKKENFKIFKTFKMFLKNRENDGSEMVHGLGIAIQELSKIVKKSNPDIILSGFDIAANLAVTIVGAHMNIPVAHIQGGEVSGTIDESIRHAMSKFSHYHFVSNLDAKIRLIKMGEIKKNIYIVGCPSIDALNQEAMLSKEYIKKKFSIDLDEKYLILIQHPVTSEVRSNEQISNTLKALGKFNIAKLIIFPNNDAGSKKIIKVLKNSKFKIVKTLNLREYKTLLSNASLLVGNSSSGIHEAATYKLPVVNIGSRQNGRLKSINVINANYSTQDIIKKIKFVLNNLEFKRKIKSIKNPYGDGNSASKITLHLSKIKINKVTTQKKITY
jgi:GDP/UDP-N,N'-diacetylbacillosamine 2-epimerase (hydrolysing)